jgi:hypothetical protein
MRSQSFDRGSIGGARFRFEVGCLPQVASDDRLLRMAETAPVASFGSFVVGLFYLPLK